MAEKIKTLGGARAGAGRPSFLKDPVRRNIIFERRHLAKLSALAKRLKLKGQSAVIRYLLDKS